MNRKRILIVGAGLSGAVAARMIVERTDFEVEIIDKRNHIAGNCYDFVDKNTSILQNEYGAHLFHTNNEKVWMFLNQFSKWIRWDHRVLADVNNQLIPLPINIETVNKLFDLNISDEKEFDLFLESQKVNFNETNNGEEEVLSKFGYEIYEKLFKYYTFKQWNKFPSELDPSVLARIPLRRNFDTRYFSDKYQALPEKGYTNLIENMLNHERISVKLNVDYFIYKNQFEKPFKTIYTGPIDSYFADFGLPKLEYRSIDFEKKTFKSSGFFQSNSVINYPSMNVPYTRIVEYKHFLAQKSDFTTIVIETTNDHGDPYYPVPNNKNQSLFLKYKKLADKERDVKFLGRLANYKYYNMDQAVEAAMIEIENFINETNGN